MNFERQFCIVAVNIPSTLYDAPDQNLAQPEFHILLEKTLPKALEPAECSQIQEDGSLGILVSAIARGGFAGEQM